jgi:hypothetical protein
MPSAKFCFWKKFLNSLFMILIFLSLSKTVTESLFFRIKELAFIKSHFKNLAYYIILNVAGMPQFTLRTLPSVTASNSFRGMSKKNPIERAIACSYISKTKAEYK